SLQESDAFIVVLNMDAPSPEALIRLIETVEKSGKPWVPIITKTDLPQSHRLLKLQELVENKGKAFLTANYKRSTSELREDLLTELINLLPESPSPLFDPELYTTQSLRDLTREIVREKCFDNLREEVPFGLAVEIRKFEENSAPTVKIHADLILQKDSHKPMVVGKQGTRIKYIGVQARKDIEKLLQRPVFLNLFVRVRKNWTKNAMSLKELGYELNR
ncbi:MAG: KH domain-containing protein, partial [Bdellovibrionales bacterium]|nr:KH domain-containing protein [Bdellovibrionales bacterium]